MIDVEDLKDRIGILDLLEEYGARTKRFSGSGAQVSVWCPFCHDKDSEKPGATANVNQDVYKCFVCDIGGDIIRLVERVEDLDFVGACEWLDKTFPHS